MGSPSLLVETDVDMDVRTRSPAWRSAGVFVFVGCIFFFATAFNWHRVNTQRSTASRLACADAIIFAGTLLLSALILSCLRPEADWNPKHLNIAAISGVLAFATAGAGVIFWRVRTAYAMGAIRVWRAASEGLLAASVVVLCALVVDPVIYLIRWGTLWFGSWPDLPTFVMDASVFILIGASTGVIFWVINQSLTKRDPGVTRLASPASALS